MSGVPVTGSPRDDTTLGAGDRLRLDYQQTADLLRTLTDVRFKLLALVPTLSGAAVALLGHPTSAVELLALGVLGLTATLGILFYELRNSQLYDYALHRARHIEAALGVPAIDGASASGGLFGERPTARLRLLGLVTVSRDGGLALVYGAALAGWSYLVAWGALRAGHVGSSRSIGAGIGLAVGAVVLSDLLRVHERAEGTTESPASTAITAGR